MRTRDRIVHAAGFAVLGLIAAGCVFGRVAFSPDSKRMAAVVRGDWPEDATDAPKESPYELWVTDLETWEHRLVATEKLVGVSPAWSPDGRDLWFLRGEEKETRLARWDGKSITDLGAVPIHGDPSGLRTTPPQVLPDGKGVIVTKCDLKDDDVAWIVRWDPDTGQETVLADRAGGAVLSPAGDRILFLGYETDDLEQLGLYVMLVAGGERRLLASIEEKLNDIAMSPLAWSPDGTLVAWVDATEGTSTTDHTSVYVADVATGARVFVSPPQDSCLVPIFSAGSDAVFYAAEAKAHDETLRAVRADLTTGEVTDVAHSGDCVPAGVSPDGRYLALRRTVQHTNSKLVKDQTVVRLVTLTTGEFRDDWVNARQRRMFAAAEVVEAEALAKQLQEALKRAAEHLDGMAEQFPDSEQHSHALMIRERLDALRATETDDPK